MEDNDIVTFHAGRYNVVVLEPTLVYLDGSLPKRVKLLRKGTERQRAAALRQTVVCYQINELMGRWIHQQGHQHSIPTALWGFGERALFDALIEHVDRLFGRYVFRYEHFSAERDAVAALMADGSIHSVYDADPARVDRAWRMRGHRVLRGQAP